MEGKERKKEKERGKERKDIKEIKIENEARRYLKEIEDIRTKKRVGKGGGRKLANSFPSASARRARA